MLASAHAASWSTCAVCLSEILPSADPVLYRSYPAACPFGCGGRVAIEDHEVHKAECPRLRCDLCGVASLTIQQDHQISSCPESLVSCPNADCGLELPRKDSPAHAAECPKRTVGCSYPLCDFKGPADTLPVHVEGAVQQHLLLALRTVSELKGTVARLEAQWKEWEEPAAQDEPARGADEPEGAGETGGGDATASGRAAATGSAAQGSAGTTGAGECVALRKEVQLLRARLAASSSIVVRVPIGYKGSLPPTLFPDNGKYGGAGRYSVMDGDCARYFSPRFSFGGCEWELCASFGTVLGATLIPAVGDAVAVKFGAVLISRLGRTGDLHTVRFRGCGMGYGARVASIDTALDPAKGFIQNEADYSYLAFRVFIYVHDRLPPRSLGPNRGELVPDTDPDWPDAPF
ncbi:hypothetical protein DFJ74DRAFT_706704 [Hyaloraphidium curvatum]|nr:hypothetical protein DFJ74DRAFT_706704 [Hyaloraphidium curvatum]